MRFRLLLVYLVLFVGSNFLPDAVEKSGKRSFFPKKIKALEQVENTKNLSTTTLQKSTVKEASMWGQIGAAIADAAENTAATYRDDYYWHANKDLQRKYAENSIQWKVQDAKKAGVHPLAALGANTMSFSPQTVGQMKSDFGQNLGRAINAGLDKESRELDLRIKRAQAQNAESEAGMSALDLKERQDIATKPIQSVIKKPHEQTMAIDAHGAIADGSSPSVSFFPTATKGIGSALSKDLKEILEDSPEELVESVKRAISNMTGSTAYKPPRSYWKKFYPDAVDVEFKFKTWDYQPVYQKGNRVRKYKKRGGGGF